MDSIRHDAFVECTDWAAEPADQPISSVELRLGEDIPPFWSEGTALGDDFDELHQDLGLSRGLFDDIMRWHESFVDGQRSGDGPTRAELKSAGRGLLRRLREEVPDRISVVATLRLIG